MHSCWDLRVSWDKSGVSLGAWVWVCVNVCVCVYIFLLCLTFQNLPRECAHVCVCQRTYVSVCVRPAKLCACKCTGKVAGPPWTKAQLFSEQLASLKRTSLPPLAAPRAPHHSIVQIIQLSPPPSESLCLPDLPLLVLPSLLSFTAALSDKAPLVPVAEGKIHQSAVLIYLSLNKWRLYIVASKTTPKSGAFWKANDLYGCENTIAGCCCCELLYRCTLYWAIVRNRAVPFYSTDWIQLRTHITGTQ